MNEPCDDRPMTYAEARRTTDEIRSTLKRIDDLAALLAQQQERTP